MHMSPRIYVTAIFISLCAMVFLVANVGRKTDANGTAISAGTTAVNCEMQDTVSKELSEQLVVDSDEGRVTIRGLVFTACVDSTLNLSTNFLNTAYEVSKEVVYRQNDKTAFETTLEVKTAAAVAVYTFIENFPEYKGRISVYVGSSPATSERKVSATSRGTPR